MIPVWGGLLIAFGSVVFYGVTAALVGTRFWRARLDMYDWHVANHPEHTKYCCSKPDNEAAVFAGLFWPIGVWAVLALSWTAKIDRERAARLRLEKKLEPIRRELNGL